MNKLFSFVVIEEIGGTPNGRLRAAIKEKLVLILMEMTVMIMMIIRISNISAIHDESIN
jgi:hypothetical protein